MNEAQFLHEASEWVIQGAFWCSAGFVAWYSLLANWWKYSVGRAIVALDTAIALATFPTVLGLIFGAGIIASSFYTWLTVFAFACIPVITTWRGVIVWRVRRAARRISGEPPEAVPAGSSDAG